MNEVIQFNGIEGVIFHADNVRAQTLPLPFTGALWTPTRDQVISLETRLPEYLTELPGDKYDDHVFYDLATYIRQYAGIEADGEQAIRVNFICPMFDGLPDYWNKLVIGRGGCYFQVTYHLKTQTFSNFTNSSDS